MFVPDRADDDVEAEFIAFRSHLDTRYYPEFCELFVDALSAELQKLKNSGQNPMTRLHGLMGSQPREASSARMSPTHGSARAVPTRDFQIASTQPRWNMLCNRELERERALWSP